MIQLNYRDSKPIYEQIKDGLRKLVISNSLSADEKLWEKTHRQMSDTGIYFNQVRLGSVTLEQYILFHAAKDAYHGTKHIRLSELTDRELVPDEILRLIVNAFVIERYGMDIVEQKMCEEILEERNYTVLAQS